MPRRSLVHDHPRRAQIDELLLDRSRSVAGVARDFGVPIESLKRYARKLRDGARVVEPVAFDGPLETFRRAFSLEPLPHQVQYLTDRRATLVLKGRQTGFTTATAGLAVHIALTKPGSTSVIVSPSLRQSSEVTDRARLAFWQWDAKLRQDSSTQLRTASGSRIISLPGSARGIRGYAVDGLLVVDEAAFVDDATWTAAWPLVSASGGRIIVQSTPGLALGFFHQLVTEPPDGWAVIRVTSAEAGTVDSAFLDHVRATMAPELYAQEYEATFAQPTAAFGGLFTDDLIERSLVDDAA